MKEKWPIDGEQLFEFLSDKLVKESGAFSKGVNKGLNIDRSAIHNIDVVKPIDIETLPLVKELRKKIEELEDKNRRILYENLRSESSLENITLRAALQAAERELRKVTAERDAAVERVKHYAGCWECDKREKGECAMPFYKDECDEWEWRGLQEDKNEEEN